MGMVVQVIIAGAGGAAHLPGMVAALTPVPVVGVPVKTSTMSGQAPPPHAQACAQFRAPMLAAVPEWARLARRPSTISQPQPRRTVREIEVGSLWVPLDCC